MPRMSEDEAVAFLADGARTGKLATVSRAGRPHVGPVWFVLDGRDVVFTSWHKALKSRHLRRDPRTALCVDDERPPFSFVEVRGEVTIDPAAPDLLDWTTRIATRYMGVAEGAAYGRRNAVEGEWLMRLRPERVAGVARVAD
jgi:hypothetical protein